MRILLVHNYYGSSAPSGENQVFESEKTLLETRGHDVAEFTRHSDEIRTKGAVGTLQGAFATPWNVSMFHAMRRSVERFRPDLVHVHNSFPLISPSIFHAIGHRCAKVLTLHNYRLFCPAAIPMRNGHICTECLDAHAVSPSLIHGCYRDSRLATIPLAINVAMHRAIGTWTRQVDAFIALTEFQRELMVKAGLPESRVHVKPNFYPGNPSSLAWKARGDYAVFAGRLSQEKGVEALVHAWKLWGDSAPELRIVGDGPLRGALERMSTQLPIRFFGQVSEYDAKAQIAHAKLLILPSEWFEGFPLVVREAFAFGTPVAASDIGSLPYIVHQGENGIIFKPADPSSLLTEVRTAWCSPGQLEKMSQGARRSFEGAYTEEVNYTTLMQIYEQAMTVNRNISGAE